MKPVIFLLILVISASAAPVAEAFTFEGYDIKLTGKAGETYDDNVAYREDNVKDDLITNLTAGIDVTKESKTWQAGLKGSVKQEVFAFNRGFNNLSEDMTLDFRKEFTKYDRVSLTDSFLHAEEPTTFEDAFGSRAGRYGYYRNILDLRYEKDMTKQMSLSAGYTSGIYIPSRSGYSDSYFNRGGLTVSFLPSSETVFSLSYDLAFRDFDPGGDIMKNTALAGIRQYLTPQIYYDCMAGADFSRSIDHKNYTTVNLMMSLTDEFSETASASVKLEKRYNDTYYSTDLSDYWQLSGTFKKRLLERLSANASANYSQGEYIRTGSTDKYFGARLGLSYDIKENIQGNLSYSYSQKDSGGGAGYDKNVISAGVNVAF